MGLFSFGTFFILALAGCSQHRMELKHDQPAQHEALPSPADSREESELKENNNISALLDTSPTEVFERLNVHSEHENLWQRLFNLYALPPIEHAEIEQELQRFLKHPDSIQRLQERAEPYLYAIVEQIEKNQLPGELALLPIIESAFEPFAYSRGQAAGLWQFIPSTGRLYGLTQNWWYDGRRDVHASTAAAIRYLKKLSNDFEGNWLHVLAAYNSGEGTVARAIQKNRQNDLPVDFWHLELPEETRQYVPRLLAIANLFAGAEAYGILLKEIANEPVFQAVDVGFQLDLALAAEMAEMAIEDFYQLNPGFNRWLTAPEGPHRLLIPTEKVEIFKQRLAALDESERVQWKRHRIRRGETLGQIASRYGTTAALIRQINHLSGNLIMSGEHLLIPISQRTLSRYAFAQRKHNVLQANEKDNQITYTVQPGDTLWDIAQKHSVSTGKLARWNNKAISDVLRPGQKLIILSQEPIQLAAAAPFYPVREIRYTVRKGDSLYVIARRFNVSIRDLKKWNGLNSGKYLRPGQKLTVYVDITHPST